MVLLLNDSFAECIELARLCDIELTKLVQDILSLLDDTEQIQNSAMIDTER
jgi:hypothetical protein